MIRQVFKNPSTVILILSNLIPLFGVLFLEWNIFSILILYWAETAVIGLYTIFKIIIFHRWKAIVLAPFFVVHFGIFMFGHLIFIVVLFANPDGLSSYNIGNTPSYLLIVSLVKPLAIAFSSLVLSHGYSFFVNYVGNKEYLERTKDPFFSPYGRIVIMHLTILFGGFLSMILGNAVFALVLMVIMKIIVDALFHMRQHGLLRR